MIEESREKTKGPIEKVQIIVFKLGDSEYALEIGQIKEVVPTPPISKVPLTPPYIRGIANVRGNILAIIDLEKKFELQNLLAETPKYTLVVDGEDLNMAILVRDVPNTLTVSRELIDESPNIIQQDVEMKNYIKGIVKREKRLIVLIDLQSIISKSDVLSVLGGA